jgi:hypothetical protein
MRCILIFTHLVLYAPYSILYVDLEKDVLYLPFVAAPTLAVAQSGLHLSLGILRDGDEMGEQEIARAFVKGFAAFLSIYVKY